VYGAVAKDASRVATNPDETIHTTARHPWLTTDHGWLPAGFLRIGETVRQVDGSTATVVAVRIVPGAAYMWDLTVSQVHDFAVGSGQFVVHNANCGDLARYDGPKPDYEVNPAHDPTSPLYNPHKTPLPSDAQSVYRHAVPDDPVKPKAWYGMNDNGDIYRYDGSPKVHFNGNTGMGSPLGDPPLRINQISRYARMRLGL